MNYKIPSYIKRFMGPDFRSEEGVNIRFDLRDFLDEKNDDTEFLKEYLKGRRGCYIITSTSDWVTYANKKTSPVLYIGMSDDLYRRLHDEHYVKHLKVLLDNKDYGLASRRITIMSDKYQYMYYYGSRVDVFFCKGTQDEKEFESSLIANFYYTFRSMPVGNGARSFSQR